MAGYYSGKKYVLEKAHESVVSDSFSDIVYHAFYSLQEAFVPYDEQQISRLNVHNKETQIDKELSKKRMGEEKLYYAEVARFASLKEAEAFIARLNHRGVEARVAVKTSVTQSGQLHSWYQVNVYQECLKKDFIKTVDAVKREHHLKKVDVKKVNEADSRINNERDSV